MFWQNPAPPPNKLHGAFLLGCIEVIMDREKNRPEIFDHILCELFLSGSAIGEDLVCLLVHRILAGDEEALRFLFLEILRRVNQSTPSPSTLCGMIPPAP